MNFEPMNFIANLHYMIRGMLSILLVIGVIILITVILNRIPFEKEEK